MIIKKYVTGTGWVAQSPKVSYTDVVVNFGQVGTEATAFPNGKLRESLLPDSVFSGMTFVGTLSVSGSPSSPFELKRLITGTATSGYAVSTNLDAFTGNDYSLDEYAGIGQRYIGHYFIVTTSQVSVFDSTNNTPEASWDTAVFDEGEAPALVGGLFADSLTLEIGDWLIITGWDNSNKTFLFRTINNNLRQATDTQSGTVKLGSATVQSTAPNTVTAAASRTYAIQKLTGTEQLVVNVPWSDTNTTYSEATSSTLGLVKIGYTENGKNYPVELNNGQMFVNVPWTDTNTTYTAGVGLDLSGTEFKMEQPHIAGTATPSASYNIADTIWFDTN